jgi:hypothetical protein
MKNDRVMISKNNFFLRGGEEVKNKRERDVIGKIPYLLEYKTKIFS